MAQKLKRKRRSGRLVLAFLCVLAVFSVLWVLADGIQSLRNYSKNATVCDVQPEQALPPDSGMPDRTGPQQDPVNPYDLLDPNTYDASLFYKENGLLRYGDAQKSRAGIDVSSHQQRIDWEKVKAAGVDFAIIRLGYRGYTEGAIQLDEYYLQNMDGAETAGLDVGVYFFSQALSPEEAVEEAEFCLQWLQDCELSYPVLYDWEDIEAEARTDGMDSITLTACAKAFCQTIEEGGFRAGIYFNQTFGYQELKLPELDEYCFWLAEYNETPTFAHDFEIWQYCCDGAVDGISTDVDLNLAFIKQPQEEKKE